MLLAKAWPLMMLCSIEIRETFKVKDAAVENVVGDDHGIAQIGAGADAGQRDCSPALRCGTATLEAVFHDEDLADASGPARFLVDDLIGHLLGHVARDGEVVAGALQRNERAIALGCIAVRDADTVHGRGDLAHGADAVAAVEPSQHGIDAARQRTAWTVAEILTQQAAMPGDDTHACIMLGSVLGGMQFTAPGGLGNTGILR